MRASRWMLVLALLLSAVPGRAETAPCGLRAEADFVLLTEGVEGGVAPKIPTLRLVIVRRENGEAAVYRADSAQGGLPTFLEGAAKDYAALERRLVALGVPDLPHEDAKEVGFFDLYGRKTALHWHRDGKCWYTQPPNGCIVGSPSGKVTDDQKKQFDSAVKAIRNEAAAATQPSTQERIAKAYTTLAP